MVKLEREIPPDLQAVFANHFVVHHEPSVFHFMFFQAEPPIFVGLDPELRRKAFEEVESIKAKCVARVVIPANQMQSIIAALVDNFQRHEATANAEGLISEQGTE